MENPLDNLIAVMLPFRTLNKLKVVTKIINIKLKVKNQKCAGYRVLGRIQKN